MRNHTNHPRQHKNKGYSHQPLVILAAVILVSCIFVVNVVGSVEYPSFDGFYNNPHFPDWGSIGQFK